MGLSTTQQKAYQQRLHRLEAAMGRLTNIYLTALVEDPEAARKLHDRLEMADIEIELIREALEHDHAVMEA